MEGPVGIGGCDVSIQDQEPLLQANGKGFQLDGVVCRNGMLRTDGEQGNVDLPGHPMVI